jgi:hypothetical protein
VPGLGSQAGENFPLLQVQDQPVKVGFFLLLGFSEMLGEVSRPGLAVDGVELFEGEPVRAAGRLARYTRRWYFWYVHGADLQRKALWTCGPAGW